MKTRAKHQIDCPGRIQRVCIKNKVSNSELARLINMRPQSITGLFNAKDCTVNRLYDISVAMEYNFFKEIADEIDDTVHTQADISDLKEELRELKEELRMKNHEIEILKESLRLVGGK